MQCILHHFRRFRYKENFTASSLRSINEHSHYHKNTILGRFRVKVAKR